METANATSIKTIIHFYFPPYIYFRVLYLIKCKKGSLILWEKRELPLNSKHSTTNKIFLMDIFIRHKEYHENLGQKKSLF